MRRELLELAIHRFPASRSLTCKETMEAMSGRTVPVAAKRRMIVARDTTEINFAGREANRRGLGPADKWHFAQPLVVVEGEMEAVPDLLDVHIRGGGAA